MTVLDDGTVMCPVCDYRCPEDDAHDGMPTHEGHRAWAAITKHGRSQPLSIAHTWDNQLIDIWGIGERTCRGVGADPWEWTAAHQADSQLPVHDDIGDTDDRLDSALAAMWRDHETDDYGDPRPYTYCHGRYNGDTRERCTVQWP